MINIDQDDRFSDEERQMLGIAMDSVGSDVFRILDALHHLAAKLAAAADVTDESLIAGQARHIALVNSRN